MRMDITLSIVMPVFNHPNELKQMIDSILANSYSDWELLTVDDGSQEETLSLLREYEMLDKRIRIIQRSEHPKGAQTCRNIGLREARGKYIIFFDSDDYITPDCLETRVHSLSVREDLDFMVFPSGVVENDVFKEKHRFIFGYHFFKDDIEYFCRRILPFVVWNNIYRTDSLRRNNIVWDVNLLSLQDADFNLATILKGLKYEYCSCKPHFGYRINVNSESVSKKILSQEHRQSNLYAINKFYETIQGRFGHKYDEALYDGVIFIYNYIFSTGIDPNLAQKFVRIVKKYSPKYGLLLKLQVSLTRLLSFILPSKLARQIPMAICLRNYHRREKKKLAFVWNR